MWVWSSPRSSTGSDTVSGTNARGGPPPAVLAREAGSGVCLDERHPGATPESVLRATWAAVLVSFGEGDRADSDAALDCLASLFGRVIVVDNNLAAARRPAHRQRIRYLHNANRGGLAGAYNAALQLLSDDNEPPAAVLWLDQDSALDALDGFLSDPTVNDLLRLERVAAVAPAYRDRATGLRGRCIELGRWRARHLPREFSGARPVAFIINSMSLWRWEALRCIGGFDEQLGIDHVDTQACLQARCRGLSVWVHGDHEFEHSIGRRRAYRLLGRDLQAGGHGPERRRSIGRNTVWLARRWAWREPAFAGLCLMRLGYEAVGIIAAEPGKLAKLMALVRGIGEGLWLAARRRS